MNSISSTALTKYRIATMNTMPAYSIVIALTIISSPASSVETPASPPASPRISPTMLPVAPVATLHDEGLASRTSPLPTSSSENTSNRYFGLSSEAWQLLFGALQALAVLIGLPYGLYQLKQLRVERRSASLEKMLEEWREDRATRDLIISKFPVADNGSPPERAAQLLQWMHSLKEIAGGDIPADVHTLLLGARTTIERVNDLGTYLELGIIDEDQLFAQFHYTIIRVVFVLEPYILLRTALRGGNRWGMRLRRLRDGAWRYHLTSPLHRSAAIALRGVAVHPPTDRQVDRLLRRRLTPTREEALVSDMQAIAATVDSIQRASATWGLSFEQMDAWFGPL